MSESAKLVVAKDGTFFRAPAQPVSDLRSRPLLARLLSALAEARLNPEDVAVARERLIEVGWPGEKMNPASAKNRLQVAITTLRKRGLRSLVEFDSGGYRLHPSVDIEVVEP